MMKTLCPNLGRRPGCAPTCPFFHPLATFTPIAFVYPSQPCEIKGRVTSKQHDSICISDDSGEIRIYFSSSSLLESIVEGCFYVVSGGRVQRASNNSHGDYEIIFEEKATISQAVEISSSTVTTIRAAAGGGRERASEGVTNSQKFKLKIQCPQFSAGSCSRGNSCPYAHSTSQLSQDDMRKKKNVIHDATQFPIPEPDSPAAPQTSRVAVPPPYLSRKREEEDKVTQLSAAMGVSYEQATAALVQVGWDEEAALDMLLTTSLESTSVPSPEKSPFLEPSPVTVGRGGVKQQQQLLASLAPSQREKIENLVSIGFDFMGAQKALMRCRWDFDRALTSLVDGEGEGEDDTDAASLLTSLGADMSHLGLGAVAGPGVSLRDRHGRGSDDWTTEDAPPPAAWRAPPGFKYDFPCPYFASPEGCRRGEGCAYVHGAGERAGGSTRGGVRVGQSALHADPHLDPAFVLNEIDTAAAAGCLNRSVAAQMRKDLAVAGGESDVRRVWNRLQKKKASYDLHNPHSSRAGVEADSPSSAGSYGAASTGRIAVDAGVIGVEDANGDIVWTDRTPAFFEPPHPSLPHPSLPHPVAYSRVAPPPPSPPPKPSQTLIDRSVMLDQDVEYDECVRRDRQKMDMKAAKDQEEKLLKATAERAEVDRRARAEADRVVAERRAAAVLVERHRLFDSLQERLSSCVIHKPAGARKGPPAKGQGEGSTMAPTLDVRVRFQIPGRSNFEVAVRADDTVQKLVDCVVMVLLLPWAEEAKKDDGTPRSAPGGGGGGGMSTRGFGAIPAAEVHGLAFSLSLSYPKTLLACVGAGEDEGAETLGRTLDAVGLGKGGNVIVEITSSAPSG